jgi:hypothetical protein
MLEEKGVSLKDVDSSYINFMAKYNDYRINVSPKDEKLKKYFFKINFGSESLASFPYRFIRQVRDMC